MGRVLSGKFCIVDDDGRFWSGVEWVAGYPDAQTYLTLKAAKAATERARLTSTCRVWENYGFDSERAVYRVEKRGAKVSTLIPADGLLRAVYPKGDKWTLEELQGHVGGYIEPIYQTRCAPGNLMLVDEDGLSKGLPVNNRASLKAGRQIVGTALIVPQELFK